jgi:hypothetical protein
MIDSFERRNLVVVVGRKVRDTNGDAHTYVEREFPQSQVALIAQNIDLGLEQQQTFAIFPIFTGCWS